MSSGFDPARVQRLASSLDHQGRTLFSGKTELQLAPDAGSSSGEVASAFELLAGVLAGIAQHIGQLSDSASATAYTRTDDHVSQAVSGDGP